MEKDLISIIMATKNTDEKMLKEAIESILNQTYKKFEFIIVCDGSVNDYNIVKEYKDERIKIIINNESIGLAASINKALKVATGEYIGRMDSDDIITKTKYELQIKYLKKHNDIDILATDGVIFGNMNKKMIDEFGSSEDKKAELLVYNKILHSSVIIKREFLDKNNLRYNEEFKYSQDYELWSRCCHVGKIEVLHKICYFWRKHDAQISTAKVVEQNELCKKIYENNLKRLNIDINKSKYLFYLSNKPVNENITYKEIKNFISEIIESNDKLKIYKKKSLKKVLYYRMFIKSLKNKKINLVIKYAILCNVPLLFIKKIFYELF